METKVISTGASARKYGVITATAIVVANMIGSGIFTTSGILAGLLPSAGMVILCWLLGGVIALLGALCYSELSTRMPEGGGEYVYLKKLYHPMFGFLTGWTSFFVGFSAPIALSAMGCTEYLWAGFSHHLADMSNVDVTWIKKLAAISIILTFTGLHYVGGKLGSGVQNFLTALKVILIAGLACGGFLFGKGDFSQISISVPAHSENIAFGTAMIMVMFSYCGWNASSYIGGEVKNPRRTLPVSLIAGTFIVTVLYLVINLLIFYSTPFDQVKGVVPVVDTAMKHLFSGWPSYILGIMIGAIMLSSLSAFIMIGPRVYHAMASDGLFFRFAAQTDKRFGVPSRSILIQGLLAAGMVIAGSFEQLLIYVGFALGIFPWLAIAGIFIARKRGIGKSNAAGVWGYPVTPILFLLINVVFMVFTYINQPLESTAAVITVLCGVPCYFIWITVTRSPKTDPPGA